MNDNRTDCDEEPSCFFKIDFTDDSEAQAFGALIDAFAREQAFVNHGHVVLAAPSPMRPLLIYSRPEMGLRGFYVIHPQAAYGQVMLSVQRRDFPRADFERAAHSLTARLQEAFRGRVLGGHVFWPERTS